MARKAVALPRLRFFQLVNGGLYRVFFVVLRVEKLPASLLRGLPAQAWQYHPQRVPGCLRFIRHRHFVFVVHLHTFYKNIKLFL